MKDYIATFYSHFGALSFCRGLQDMGIDGKPAPVPRRLSSSCGTCVKFSAESLDFPGGDPAELKDNPDLEDIYLCKKDGLVQSVLMK